jgi:hypothetical protein
MALSAEEAQLVRDTLQTPPTNPSATIDWGTDKHKCILPKTWALASLQDRLASAQHDLIKAGYLEDARLLTIPWLNGCWHTKMSSPERKALKEQRKKKEGQPTKTPSVACKRLHKTSDRDAQQGNFFSPLLLCSSVVVCLWFLY